MATITISGNLDKHELHELVKLFEKTAKKVTTETLDIVAMDESGRVSANVPATKG